jgi:hypothetical protein|tara:strand:- start:1398 stop:2105 length:708 start_codon:yes stop_codon:yes gene_type:complete
MSEQSIQAHFNYHLANSVVRNWPFPHLYYENVFPDNFYSRLIKSLPDFPVYDPISKVRPVIKTDGGVAFPDRFVITIDNDMKSLGPDWDVARDVIRSQATHIGLLSKFNDIIQNRLTEQTNVEPDSILIRDRTNYVLGPHTDNPARLAVLIIYLPENNENQHLGTSLYVPKDPMMTCPGTSHYNHSDFDRVFTAPYKPNSAVAFVKTENSFHGVEPLLAGEERNLIHYFSRIANG